MTDRYGLGGNFPPEPIEDRVRTSVPPIQVSGSENILDYPKKYRISIEQNEKLYPCCREATKHTCRVYQTPTCQPGYPFDLFIAQCGCGRKHYRLLCGSGHTFVMERR